MTRNGYIQLAAVALLAAAIPYLLNQLSQPTRTKLSQSQMASSEQIPKTMKALVVQEGRKLAVQDWPVPAVGDDDILVKNVAVALNPTDYKMVYTGPGKPGTVDGCDFSGYVVKVGKNVTTPKVGDHVAGFVMGATFPDSGAFAEYVKTPAELSWVVPEGTLTHEQASTLGCAFWTAVQGLYYRLGLVEPPEKTTKEEWIYVHGGSSAVGQFVVQLATLSGYKVVSTASPHNHDLVKSLGAVAVFDYREPDVVNKIKAVAGDNIQLGYDTISVKESQELSAAVIAPSGGRVIHIQSVKPEATTRTDVDRKSTLIYSALGRAYWETPDPADRAHMVKFLKKVPALVKQGAIKPLPIKFWEGGIDAITDGLQYLREGKVSGEKIVYRV
ncbi:GroES-like protein [Pilatotrama ljubarskyi]|nr:GroES-like protein [Pilatotrama ljubarskyi]